jgi:hypothetical protein
MHANQWCNTYKKAIVISVAEEHKRSLKTRGNKQLRVREERDTWV